MKQIADLIRINLRINVDKSNYKDSIKLLKYLKKEGLDGVVSPYFGVVTAYSESCGNIAEHCFESHEYSKIEVQMYKEALKNGFTISKYPFRIHGGYCAADSVSSMVISANGAIFKCWNYVTEEEKHAIGHLINPDNKIYYYNYLDWMKHNILESSKCMKCDVIPICMGGCPYEWRIMGKKKGCSTYKFNLVEMLKNYYEFRKKQALLYKKKKGTKKKSKCKK